MKSLQKSTPRFFFCLHVNVSINTNFVYIVRLVIIASNNVTKAEKMGGQFKWENFIKLNNLLTAIAIKAEMKSIIQKWIFYVGSKQKNSR